MLINAQGFSGYSGELCQLADSIVFVHDNPPIALTTIHTLSPMYLT